MPNISNDELDANYFSGRQAALPAVVGNIDEDPDRAQRAYDLAKITGAPATAIYGDLDEFERNTKAKMASDIVANNPHLSDFVQSDPMVPKIFANSYGTLDEVSRAISAIGLGAHSAAKHLWWYQPEAISKGFQTGIGGGKLGDYLGSYKPGMPHTPENWESFDWEDPKTQAEHPLQAFWAATITGVTDPIEAGIRMLSGAVYGTTYGVATAYKSITGKDSPIDPDQVAQAVQDPGTMASLGPLGEAAHFILGRNAKLTETIQKAMPYIENDRIPPPGVLPELDKFRADQNAIDVEKLMDATKASGAVPERPTASDLYRQFNFLHTDAEIGIGGDAVAALYGDKLPTPDDNLLGWVPGIENKLAAARATGDDVHIPLADWLTHIPDYPDVAKALHDDIRVRPEGITANEAKLTAEAKAAQPEGTVESTPYADPVAATRAASALEPMLSIGDRKLQLQKLAREPKPYDDANFMPHDFQMLDEKGNTVGALNLTEQRGGKDLYVDMINGVNGLGPRDFGPRLMADLIKQLKAEFPNAERLGGHRVSGAREKAGKEMTMPAAWIKLDRADLDVESHKLLRAILEGGQWETFAPSVQAYIKSDFARSEQTRNLVNFVQAKLQQIVPKKVTVRPADTIKVDTNKGIAGQRPGEDIQVAGIYMRYRDAFPVILYALDRDDPLGSGRHEAIHHLRAYGFFQPHEWEALKQAALAKDAEGKTWLDKHRTHELYPTADLDLKVEEAVAEQFREWSRDQDIAGMTAEDVGVFQRLKDFLDSIKNHIAQMLGKDPTWEDVFQKVSTGEVGGRSDTLARDPRSYDEIDLNRQQGALEPKLSVQPPEGGSRPFERAQTLGMTDTAFRAYDKRMQEQYAEDVAKATKRAEAQQTHQLTKEWKSNRADVRKEVADNIRNRPDVATDLFLAGDGLYGRRRGMAYKLDEEKLTPKQKGLLPPEYYGKDGLDPDDIAGMFGYGSGDAMLDKLSAYTAMKKMAGMSSKDFVNRITDIETDRQMKLRYGNLDENIMDAVKEQVVGEAGQNRVHEETLYYGSKIGAAPATRENILAAVKEEFGKSAIGSVSSDRLMRRIGQQGRAIEAAHLKEDWETAFRLAQQREYTMAVAAEAARVERDLAKAQKTFKQYAKREVAGMDPNYTRAIQSIFLKIGKPVSRSIQDLQESMAKSGYNNLSDFINERKSMLREINVPNFLLDESFRKKFEDLSVQEFKDAYAGIKSLIFNGREEQKIYVAGEAADINAVKSEMYDKLKTLGPPTGPAIDRKTPVRDTAKAAWWANVNLESMFNRIDRDDAFGVFNKYIVRTYTDAMSNEGKMLKDMQKEINKHIDKIEDIDKKVENKLWIDPLTKEPFVMRKRNALGILQNVGNESNLKKLAGGYGLKPAQVMAWLHDLTAKGVLTKLDWDRAQKLGDMFADLMDKADTMAHSVSGEGIEKIPLKPFQTPFGESRGWYNPVSYDSLRPGQSKKLMGPNALEQEGYFRATPAHGYTEDRTNYVAPMDLNLDAVPMRMKQMIHDIAMRPAIIQLSKFFYDPQFERNMTAYYGKYQSKSMIPFLVDLANSQNIKSMAESYGNQALEYLRQNTISTLVGLNPSTIMKHGTTAAINSMTEVGPINFMREFKNIISDLPSGHDAWNMAMEKSELLQTRMSSNFTDLIEGHGREINIRGARSKFMSMREFMMAMGAKPVAFFDLLSAVPTWLAEYKTQIATGMDEGSAVYAADRAVRRAHGSSQLTNKPAVMRTNALGAYFTSLYGFFNHMLQKQYEIGWKAKDVVEDTFGKGSGDTQSTLRHIPAIGIGIFSYILAPAAIEELVTPYTNNEKESWGIKVAKSLALGMSSSLEGVRDFVRGLINLENPEAGMLGASLKTATDLGRDLHHGSNIFTKQKAGDLIKHTMSLTGVLTGLTNAQEGRMAQYLQRYAAGQERPKGAWEVAVGMRYGKTEEHSLTFEQWQKQMLGGK